jgi:hypothetical protein
MADDRPSSATPDKSVDYLKVRAATIAFMDDVLVSLFLFEWFDLRSATVIF